MDAVERLKSKHLYKIELYLIKIIPMVISLLYLLDTILSYFYIDAPIISYLAGTSVLELLFLYLSSIVFRFCAYHRMFIHYITFNWITNIYDYYIGIPISSKGLFMMYLIITCIFMFLILYFVKIRKP